MKIRVFKYWAVDSMSKARAIAPLRATREYLEKHGLAPADDGEDIDGDTVKDGLELKRS